MANRNFNRLQALDKEIKHLHARVTIGASGAPTLDAENSKGVASIARDSQGVYTVTLQDKYVRLMNAEVKQIVATAQDLTTQLVAEDVDGAKTVQFRCTTAATETDPASGSVLLIKFELKNSSVK